MDENTKLKYVVDASFVLAYFLPDENVNQVDAFFTKYGEQRIEFVSIHLLPFEVLNGLQGAVRRKRLDKEIADQLAEKFLRLKIQTIPIEFSAIFQFALQKDITVYDASYVCLAKQNKLPLLTLDSRLKKLVRYSPQFKG